MLRCQIRNAFSLEFFEARHKVQTRSGESCLQWEGYQLIALLFEASNLER